MIYTEYPAWKKSLTEAYRIFTGALIAELIVLTFNEDGINLQFIQSINSADDIKKLIVVPAIVAGFRGISKWLREKYTIDKNGKKDYNHILYKLTL